MANTYTQLYIHLVFAVQFRHAMIPRDHKEEVHRYITGIVQQRSNKMLAVHCMPDHTHVLVGLHPSVAVSDLMRDIKAGSSGYITKAPWMKHKFNWQVGFGAFSVSRSRLDNTIAYIREQEKHHEKRTFREEYMAFLKEYEVPYEEQYLFEFF